jgi:hypothetical protein
LATRSPLDGLAADEMTDLTHRLLSSGNQGFWT